ncbi:MAG TPA: DUF885 domain-containing protein [Holophagaceae bacterium]|nr:DUF885 domain-containing protein [Holophagaceae bacterium]
MSTRALLPLALVTAVTQAAAPAPSRFHAMLERYSAEYLRLFPIEAAINGDSDPSVQALWPNDLTPEFRAQVATLCRKYLAELARFDRKALSTNDRLSYDSLTWNLRLREEATRQNLHLLPVNQFSCATLTFAQMGSGAFIHPFKTAQDYRDFLSRAQGFSAWVDSAIANLREGMAKGVVQPRILMERVLPQLADLQKGEAEGNILFDPLKQLPASLDAAAQAKLAAEYRAGLNALALPAYARLHAFIRDEYLPKCGDHSGLGALPGGPEAYRYLVRLQTTTDKTPEQIHAIGLAEVARIRGEMEAVKAKVGFQGTLAQFLSHVATDPKFAPFKTEQEVLDGYRALERRVMARVPQLFGQVPKTPFEIRATEAFRAATASAEYIAGAADGSRPGTFYVPIVDAAKMRTPRLGSLFLHEAIPGHHFQLSLAMENQALPRFRRTDGSNAFVEGWALYCERLGDELGVYDDPYQTFGMLLADMHRAIRLVVDTGLHAKGWTREQALAYAADLEGGSPEAQIPEIERYMANPGQALGYKMGQLKFRELRSLGEHRLGKAFPLRDFHDEILRQGALPLAVVDAHLREWIRGKAPKAR